MIAADNRHAMQAIIDKAQELFAAGYSAKQVGAMVGISYETARDLGHQMRGYRRKKLSIERIAKRAAETAGAE